VAESSRARRRHVNNLATRFFTLFPHLLCMTENSWPNPEEISILNCNFVCIVTSTPSGIDLISENIKEIWFLKWKGGSREKDTFHCEVNRSLYCPDRQNESWNCKQTRRFNRQDWLEELIWTAQGVVFYLYPFEFPLTSKLLSSKAKHEKIVNKIPNQHSVALIRI
jgi:hypothetical protein